MSVTLERGSAIRAAPPPQADGSRRWLLALVALFALSALYHWVQSLGHGTAAIFTDELMFSELARSIAAGDLFVVRGVEFVFPSILPAVFQAPVWLLPAAAAYGTAKALNAVLMSLAVFPAWALARQFLRPSYAFGVAAAAVAGGAMIYHSYLTSEAVAFPVFLLAVAASVRAIATPSIRWDALAVLLLGVAVVTRAQFVVLPIAFALTVLLVGRPLRRHALALSALGALGVAAMLGASAVLGFYSGGRDLDFPALETLRWAGWTAALLPFAAGIVVLPGALLGLGCAVASPRARAESAFGVMSLILVVSLPLQAGLIAAGEAHRPMERYAFYAVPLLFAAFFLYVERGGPSRRLYAGVGLGLAGLVLLVPLMSLAQGFSFDSPTLSAVDTVGRTLSPGDAAALFTAAGVLGALVVSALPLQRWGGEVASVSIVLAFAVGVAAYSGDHRMTRRAADSLAPAQKDWLDRTGVEADILVLPGSSLHAGWMLESWNRNAGRTFHLGDFAHDPLPHTVVRVLPDGSVPGVSSRHLVVNHAATQIDLEGQTLATPRPDLSLHRTGGRMRLRSFAEGLYVDGWARAVLTYAVWPTSRAGEYRVRLELPAGHAARSVEVEAGSVRRTARLVPATPLELRIPAAGRPIPKLQIRVDRADLVDAESPRPRLVAARVTALRFVPSIRSRNR